MSRVATQMRARGNAHEVQPNWKSLAAHLDVADKFFPHLEVVGDYHTHPYRSLTQLLAWKGWEHSETDEQSLPYFIGKVAAHESKPRFSLVVAIAMGGKSGKAAYRRRSNTYDDKVTLHLPAMV